MSPIEQAEALVATMTRGEKALLLQRVARDIGDAYPGIDSTADVAGGDPCVARTRVPVWTLEQTRRLGASEAELLRTYPRLLADENFPFPVVESLRRLGYDVVTLSDLGLAGQARLIAAQHRFLALTTLFVLPWGFFSP